MFDELGVLEPAITPRHPHDFCGTATRDRLSAWLEVLGLQVELFLPAERAALEALPSWRLARRVLDVGCGDGSYLSALSERFPDKGYTGLETSPEFVAAARHRALRFDVVEADFFAYAPADRFDFVLMRFVVQHLDDWSAVLAHARALLTPGGSLLVVEPDTAAFSNTPPLPLFTRMLTTYGSEAQTRGRLRASLDELGSQAAEQRWHVARDTRHVVVSTGPFAGTRLMALYRGWTALCRQCGYVAADYDAIERELANWGRNAEARSEIGLRLLELQPA